MFESYCRKFAFSLALSGVLITFQKSDAGTPEPYEEGSHQKVSWTRSSEKHAPTSFTGSKEERGNDKQSVNANNRKLMSTGSVFTISSETRAYQGQVALTKLASDKILAAWQVEDSQTGVYCRVIDASGTPIGSAVRVNSARAGGNVALATLADGRVLATWQGTSPSGTQQNIYSRLIDTSGTPIGSEATVNSVSSAYMPSLLLLSDGNVLAVWSQSGSAGIHGKLINSSGASIGSEVRIDSVGGSPDTPTLALLSNNKAFVAWVRSSGGVSSLYGRTVDTSLNLIGSDVRINFNETGYPNLLNLASAGNGNAIATWSASPTGTAAVYVRAINGSGIPVGPDIQISTNSTLNQAFSKLASLPDGGVFAVWPDYPFPKSSHIYGRSLNSLGEPTKNVSTIIHDESGNPSVPTAISFSQNKVLVAWQGSPFGNSSRDIYGILHSYTDSGTAATGTTSPTTQGTTAAPAPDTSSSSVTATSTAPPSTAPSTTTPPGTPSPAAAIVSPASRSQLFLLAPIRRAYGAAKSYLWDKWGDLSDLIVQKVVETTNNCPSYFPPQTNFHSENYWSRNDMSSGMCYTPDLYSRSLASAPYQPLIGGL